MKIQIGSQEIDAAVCEGSVNIAEGTYPFVDVATAKALTGAQVQEMCQAGFAALDDIGSVVRRFLGYNEVHEHRVIFVKTANTEQQLVEAGEKLQAVTERHEALARAAATVMTDEQATANKDVWPEWSAGRAYQAGDIVRQADVLYKVLQAHTSQAHQPPSGAGMLAVYAPIQPPAEPGVVLPWVNGETGLSAGDKRSYNGKVYEAIQAPGANVWTPDSVPAIWKAVA